MNCRAGHLCCWSETWTKADQGRKAGLQEAPSAKNADWRKLEAQCPLQEALIMASGGL